MPSRRAALLGAASLLAPSRAARAQNRFPDRPVRLIVPFGAGGISDLVARLVAEAAAPLLGQPVVVENRTGAGGNIAAEAAARAAPDGHALLFASLGMLAVNPLLFRRLPFDPARDFATVLPLSSTPFVLVAKPGPGARDLADFLGAARAAGGDLTWSTAGVGSAPHQAMLLLQSLADVRMTAVHYRSGAAGVAALLSGEVMATAEATPVVAEHVRAGTLRALAVAAPTRIALLPDIPTAAEAGLPGLETGSSAGLLVPRATPEPVRTLLAEAFGRALANPALRQRLEAQGTLPLPGDAAAFDALVAAEKARWTPLLTGISLD